jgi:hypothetical protein
VRREVVHHHDLSGPQPRHQGVLDERAEHVGARRGGDRRRRDHAPDVDRGPDRQQLPVAVRHAAGQPPPARRSPAQARELRCCVALVEHDEVGQRDALELVEEDVALGRDVRPQLLAGDQRLFL